MQQQHKMTEARWFKYKKIFSRVKADFVEVAVERLCLLHVSTCEAYPAKSVEKVHSLWLQGGDFTIEFNGVAGMVLKRFKQGEKFRNESVMTCNFVGLRIARDVALVRRDEFKRLIGADLGAPGCSAPLLQLPSYERGFVEGTLLEIDCLPEDARWERVTIFSEHGREYKIELLGVDNIYRREQASERYTQSVNQMIENHAGA